MAIAARGGCRHVINRFCGRLYKAAWRVAAHTDRLCGTEGRADMTPFAGYVRMRAVEYEPGTEVIKGLLRRRDEAVHRANEQYEYQKQPKSGRSA